MDNNIAEEDEQGNKHIRFQPVPAWETAELIIRVCILIILEMRELMNLNIYVKICVT